MPDNTWIRVVATLLCISAPPIPSFAACCDPAAQPDARTGLQTSAPSSSPFPAVAQAAPNGDLPPPAEEKSTSIWERDTLTGDWDGRRTKLEQMGIYFGLQEQSEVWGNLRGGQRQGATYVGLTTASLKLNLDRFIPNTIFFVNAFQIHGRGPSANLVGNLQLVSNLEATRGTKLYDLWIETKFLDGDINLRIGQDGANDEMMTTAYGTLFLNSSFGFPALAASDLPSGGPNYPIATPFVRVRYDAGRGFTLVGAVYNGDPAPPGSGDPQSRDAGGTAFRLNDHVLSFAELWYSPDKQRALPTTYKLGAWFHSGHFADQYYDVSGVPLASLGSNGMPRQRADDFAIYGIIDQRVWHPQGIEDQGVGLFLQVMVAPDDRNVSNLFVEAGMNWKAPFPKRASDMFGLAVAYEGISSSARQFSRDYAASHPGATPYASNETVLEATYLYQVAPWWTLQPDAQYVINPGAGVPVGFSNRLLKNAVVVGLHAAITF